MTEPTPEQRPDIVLDTIARQDLACMLIAVRSRAEQAGLWDEARHGAAFEAKRQELFKAWN